MLRETQLKNALTRDVPSDEAGYDAKENKIADQRKAKETLKHNAITSGVVEHQTQILEKFESRKRAAQPEAGPK